MHTIRFTIPRPTRLGWANWLKRYPVSEGWYTSEYGVEFFAPAQDAAIDGLYLDQTTGRVVLFVSVSPLPPRSQHAKEET